MEGRVSAPSRSRPGRLGLNLGYLYIASPTYIPGTDRGRGRPAFAAFAAAGRRRLRRDAARVLSLWMRSRQDAELVFQLAAACCAVSWTAAALCNEPTCPPRELEMPVRWPALSCLEPAPLGTTAPTGIAGRVSAWRNTSRSKPPHCKVAAHCFAYRQLRSAVSGSTASGR